FYSALLNVLQQVQDTANTPKTVTAAATATTATDGSEAGGGTINHRMDWVVALTDGDDNSSRQGDFELVQKMLRNMQSVGMIAITVGMLPNAPQIQALLDAVPDGRDHAVMIKADTSGGSIKQAFVQAVRIIGGALVVESL
ncbi:hypothetical protein HK405_013024, partial [Cladochytrium tenue]